MLMGRLGTITTADYLPYTEYLRLLKCLEEDGDYRGVLYCTLSFCLALRVSDILKLKWYNIYGKNNVTVTEKKTKKTKPIVIGANAQQRISDSYKKMGKPQLDDYIFKTPRKDAPITKQYINKVLKEWKEKYKLEVGNISTHTFRKTFGRYVYEKMNHSNESLVLLNRIFRHSSIQTTMIYIGIRDEEIKDIFEELEL